LALAACVIVYQLMTFAVRQNLRLSAVKCIEVLSTSLAIYTNESIDQWSVHYTLRYTLMDAG